MDYKFYIYPDQCAAQTEGLGTAASELESCAARLEAVKNQISQLGGSYGAVAASLDSLIQEVRREKKGMNSLKDTLKECVSCYTAAENKITGSIPKIGKIEPIGGQNSIWADTLSDIADFRGGEWAVLLESLLMRGIFGNDVLKDVKKILGGTYLVSEWVDNKLHLKLHQNGMTNAQIGAWLEDNLGGSWDDYRSRNMRDYNFSVYDYETGNYTRTGRYFDNLTDVQLSKYLDDLRDSSLGKTFNSNFNILDDFDYTGFKNMDVLAKTGKVLGTAGTILTIGGDVVDNFYDSATDSWSFSGNQAADCVWDIGVDLGTAAGSAAAGAAVGSLIVPPVGTVVGAGVGIAVDVVANNVKLWDVDGDGEKDSLVDTVKIGGHAAIDWIEDTAGDVGDWLQDAFSF